MPLQKPIIAGVTNRTLEEGADPVLIGTVTPAFASDGLSLNVLNPGRMLGSLTLVGAQVFYTPPSGKGAFFDQIDYSISESGAGTSTEQLGRFLVEPAPAFTETSSVTPVEVGQQIIIGQVSVTLPNDPLTLTQTSGTGTVSLGYVSKGVQQVIYTAPGATAGVASDTVSFSIEDQYGLSTSVSPLTITLDPGPNYVAAIPGIIETGQATVVGSFTPGLPNDILRLIAADAGLSLGPVLSDGSQDVIYTAPAGALGTQFLSYSVVDQNLGGNSYSAQVLIDGGPVAMPMVYSGNLENSQSCVIGTVAPGQPGDTLSVTQDPGSLGLVSLGAPDQDGVQQIIYSAPAHILATALDTVSYSIFDQYHGSVATGSASVQLDRGLVCAPVGPVVLAAGQSAVVDTVIAGLPGDVVTLAQTVAGLGSFTLVQTVDGGTSQPNQYNVVYTQTGAFTTSQRDTASFQLTDRIGGKVAGDTPQVRLDAGPKLVTSLMNVKVMAGQTVTIGIVAAGLAGDVLTIAGDAGSPGLFSLSPVNGSVLQKILYTAPNVVQTNGPVALGFTISDQTGVDMVTGSSSAIVTNPLPTIVKQSVSAVESGQTTVIGIVNPGSPVDTLTLTQTGTALGALSLVTVNGITEIQYSAPTSFASSGTDRPGYIVTDEHGGTVSGIAAVTLDAGPKLSRAVPGVVVQGQSTVIGTITPGVNGDVETLTQNATAASQGTVTLVGNKVIYTAAASVSATGPDAVSYTIADQHQDTVVNGSAVVKVLGAVAVNSDAPITSATNGAFFDLIGGSPAMSFLGANSAVLLDGSASPTINDHARGLVVDVASSNVSANILNFAADARGVIDLLHGVGGYDTAAAAQAALTSDGQGGSLLSLGGGFIHFTNLAASAIAASVFKIG